MSESNDNLIGYIASTIETMPDEIAMMRGEMATKKDLGQSEDKLSERLEAATTGIRGDIE